MRWLDANVRAWLPIAAILGGGVALVFGQMAYVRAKLPEVRAEVTAAQAEAASVFAQLTPPVAAEAEGGIERQARSGGRRGKWQGVESGFVWTQAWMVPGEFGPVAEAYRERLQGLGWVSFGGVAPSAVQCEFKRGKWIVTLSGNEWWDHPRRTRVRVRLEWDFRHRTDP